MVKTLDGRPYLGKTLSSLLVALTVVALGGVTHGDGTGPIAQWSFEDAADLGADSIGTYPMSAVAGDSGSTAPSQVTDGHSGNAVRITRTGSVVGYAMLGTDQSILPSGTSPFTVSVWIRPSSNSSKTAYIINRMQLVSGKPNAWTAPNRWSGWLFRFVGDGDRLLVHFNGWSGTPEDSNKGALAWIPAGQYNDGKWHHAAFSLNSAKKVTIYWDGVKVGAHTLTTGNVGNDTRLLIGSYEKSNGYSGDYDEIKFYNRTLSDAEIVTEAGASPLTLDAGGNYVFDVPDETLQTNKVIFGGLDGWIKTGGGTLLEDAYLWSFKGTGVVETGSFRTSIENPLPAMSGLSIASGATFEFGRNANYAGTLSGTGTMRFSGFGADALSGTGWPAFTGTYQLYAANVDFGTAASPLAIASGAALDIANGGALNFHDDVTVRKLGGVGLMGAVNVPVGGTVTVNGSDDSSFSGIVNGDLVKSGSGTLTLAGASVTGGVAVTGGTLALDRLGPVVRPNLYSIWQFNEADNPGRDSGDGGLDFEVKTANASSPAPTLVAGGVSGKALRIARTSSAVGNAMLCGTGLPSGDTPFTLSAWIRPDANCHGNAYIILRMTLEGVPDGWTTKNWNGWLLRFSNSGATLAFRFKNWASATASDEYTVCGSIPAGEYKDGRWHHVVATRDASKKARIYWDGVKVGEQQLSYGTVAATSKLLLGSYEKGNGYSGDYDEIQYLDTVWTDEQVAAEYAARVPAEVQPKDSLPTPVAHWTFDEIDEVGDAKLFRDSGPNGWDLQNMSNGNSYVECVTGDGINGGAAYVRTAGTYLQLNDGVDPTATFGAKQTNFTFSARFKNVSRTSSGRWPFICLGNAHGANTCLRYSFEQYPLCLRILPGSANKNEGYDITDTYVTAGADAPWTTVTCVEDCSKHVMKVYREGTFVQTLSTSGSYSGSAFYFDLSRIDVGYNTYNKYHGFMVDDMRLYAGCLSEGQIRALVREQSGMALDSPLAESSVSVASGAELAAKAGVHSAAAVSGAGTVSVTGEAVFGADDWSAFTGSVTGDGYLAVRAKVPAAATVSGSTRVLVGGTIATDLAGSNLPLITGVGSVKVADAGVVQITNAPTAYSTASKTFVLARGSSVSAPAEWSGWSVSPSNEDVPYAFSAAGGVFKLTVKGGIVIIFR